MKTIYDLMRESKAREYQVMALADAIGYLNNLIDTSKESSCGVANEHKEAVKIYVESWITPTLQELLRSMLGNKRSIMDLKDRVRRGWNDHAYDGYKDIINF